VSDPIETPQVLDELARRNGATVQARPRAGRLVRLLRVLLRLVLVLLLVTSLAIVAFLQWNLNTGFNRLTAENSALRESLQLTQSRLASLEAGVVESSGESASQALVTALREEFAERLTALNRELAAVQARLPGTAEQQNGRWRIAEAHHLLRLANRHLALTADVSTASALLVTADRLLAESGEQKVLPARRALAGELDRLRVAAASDAESTYRRLGRLRRTLGGQETGPTLQEAYLDRLNPPPATSAGGVDPLAPGTWLDAGLATLRAIFIWRRWPAEPAVVVAPDALIATRSRLGLLLEQAQLALLTRQRTVFRDSLRAAQELADRYRAMLGQQAEPIIAELASLGDADALPELPDLSSLEALVGELLPVITLPGQDQ
jgi:uroporphyrin-3 C-methyltransferase